MTPTDSEKELLESTQKAILQPWHAEHHSVPEVLYHYTSADGLIGILQSRSFWLTDLRYVNDASELQYARSLVRSRIDEHITADGLTEVQAEFLRRARSTFDPFEHGSSVFAASFCEVGNLLSQWRAYRGSGGGYAIGVDFFHTSRFLSRRCALRRVVYEAARQRELIDGVLEGFLAAIACACGGQTVNDSSGFLPAACQAFAATTGEFLFAFKHPDFVEEREWRLVHFANVDPRMIRESPIPCVRSYQGNIIPYFPVDFGKAIDASRDDTIGVPFPIADVIIGPTINGELNQQSIRTLLLCLNPDVEPRIRLSDIPLRWL